MLKITPKNIGKIKLLEDEKNALEKLLEKTTKAGYTLYLFGSRLKGWGVDIDVMIKPAPSLKELIKFETLFSLYTHTKLDLIPYKEETKYFFDSISQTIK